MQTRTRHIAGILFVVALVATIIAASCTPAAQSHVITRTQCSQAATAHNQHPTTPTLAHWRYHFRACLARAATHRRWHLCATPRPVVPYATVKHHRASLHQRRVISRTLRVGYTMRARLKVHRAAIATITQESTATNLRGGHGSSAGPFQIISLHGSYAQRTNIEWSARWFYSRAINVNRHRPGLTVGQLAQAVQRSAHPGAYAQWVTESTRTVRRYFGPAIICVRQ